MKDNPTAEVGDFRLWSDPRLCEDTELRTRDDAFADGEDDDAI